nr:DUF4368 domain-containing protein [uncultured Oscillibacter sp.]
MSRLQFPLHSSAVSAYANKRRGLCCLSVEDAGKWVKLIRQYNDITGLDAPLLNTPVEKVVIHEASTGPDGIREQEAEICCRFVGKIDL